jgi:hypothetical protein
MVQVLEMEEQEQIIIIIPEKESKVEKSFKKEKLQSQASGFSKHAKYHEELICINKLKSKLDANLYRNKMNVY